MSREIIAFHGWLGFVLAVAIFETGLMPAATLPSLAFWLGAAAGLAGIVAIVCSAMIYVATRRDFWTATDDSGSCSRQSLGRPRDGHRLCKVVCSPALVAIRLGTRAVDCRCAQRQLRPISRATREPSNSSKAL
jgi:hypothetical protein